MANYTMTIQEMMNNPLIGVFDFDYPFYTDDEKMKNYEEDTNAQLIAPAPYDSRYVYWLMAQIDLAAAELNRYNNSMELFNEAMKNFKAWYNRTHRPLPKPAIRLGIDGGC